MIVGGEGLKKETGKESDFLRKNNVDFEVIQI